MVSGTQLCIKFLTDVQGGIHRTAQALFSAAQCWGKVS